MTEIREVDVSELSHLVSERALTGETMVLNMGTAAPFHPRRPPPDSGTGRRNHCKLHSRYWFPAHWR